MDDYFTLRLEVEKKIHEISKDRNFNIRKYCRAANISGTLFYKIKAGVYRHELKKETLQKMLKGFDNE